MILGPNGASKYARGAYLGPHRWHLETSLGPGGRGDQPRAAHLALGPPAGGCGSRSLNPTTIAA